MAILKDLQVGEKIVDNKTKYDGIPIEWVIVHKNYPDYPNGTVTIASDKVITFKAIDGAETSAYYNPDIKDYGYNNYKLSNIRQWLNSNRYSYWYTPQHDYDEPPSYANVTTNPYDHEAGFMYNFSDAFLESIVETELKVNRNTPTDNGGVDYFYSKVFLADYNELFNVVGGSGGFDYFKNGENLITYSRDGRAVDWWLRSPMVRFSNRMEQIRYNGNSYAYFCNHGEFGIRPFLNLKESTKVSSSKNSKGLYELFKGLSLKFKNNNKITNSKSLSVNGKNIANIYVKDQNGNLRNVK